MSKLKPPINHADHHFGNPKASVSLVEFGDFECPHCAHAHPLVKQLLNEMGDQIHFVFRHFPLQEVHPHAYHAALAAEAAGKQGKFWEMHDLIYENQPALNDRLLLELALALGLDMEKFEKDWNSKEAEAKVDADIESGVRSGVNGTPTFFVNNTPLYSYDGTYESLEEGVRILH
jgi:protein-disulfide isomerase